MLRVQYERVYVLVEGDTVALDRVARSKPYQAALAHLVHERVLTLFCEHAAAGAALLLQALWADVRAGRALPLTGNLPVESEPVRG
jgi:hypothetical protein